MSSEPPILRTGVLFKKGSGTGPFGRRNWKPRYFVLTPVRLQYFTFEDGECRGEVSLEGCDEGVLEVMPADSMKTGSSASTIWRVAINAPARRLLVAAGTEMEMNDWVDKLVLAFRMNSGQPPPPSMHRASMPASTTVGSSTVNSNPSIRDFHNFSVPRRGGNHRHSTGAAATRLSLAHSELLQVESIQPQQLLEEQGKGDRQAPPLERQEDEDEQQQQRQAEQDAEMRNQLAIQQQRELEETTARAQQEAALAAAEELQGAEEQEKLAQQERKRQHQEEMEMQPQEQSFEAEAARIQDQQEQEVSRNKRMANELAIPEQPLTPKQGEDLLEVQRRQKREEHAHQRAEREKALKLKLQQKKEDEDLAFRLTQQMNSRFSVDDELDDSDTDNEPECLLAPGVSDGSLSREDVVHQSAAALPPAAAPRSSLVGDVKREMIQKQQIEHQRRREVALKQQQQTRSVEWRQQHVESEQQRARMEASNVREAREVEVAPREIEVVRRAPVKKPAPVAAPMESFEF